MTSMKVLAASQSAFRRDWYVDQLRLYGIEVATAVDGIDCVVQMRTWHPEIVVLEPSLLWGGSVGVLAVREEETELRQIPVVLIAANGISANWYQLAQYSLQGLILRRPSGQKLASVLLAAIHEPCHENSVIQQCSEGSY